MCWCTPGIRTPNCGAINCHPPAADRSFINVTPHNFVPNMPRPWFGALIADLIAHAKVAEVRVTRTTVSVSGHKVDDAGMRIKVGKEYVPLDEHDAQQLTRIAYDSIEQSRAVG